MRILTVRRSRAWLVVLLTLTLPVLLVLPAPAATKAHIINCALPVGGTVASIDAGSRTFEMNISSNGVGVATVWVQKASVIVIREVDQQTQAVIAERPARFEDLRAGHRVAIQAMCLDDGRLIVISGAIVHVISSGTSTSPSSTVAAPPTGPAPGSPGGGKPPSPGGSGGGSGPPTVTTPPSSPPILVVEGTVLGKTAVSLTVGGKSLATVTLRIDSSTRVSGQRSSLATIMLNDVVRIEAVRGSGGVLSAKAIAVLAVQVKTITGTIVAVGNGSITVRVDGTNATQVVNIAGATVIQVNGVVQTATAAAAQLTVGARVTISGTVEAVKNTAASVGANATAKIKAVVVKVLK